MNKTPSGLHHVAMNVSDIERSITFYSNAFGMKIMRRWGDSPRGAMLDMGDGAILELFERPEATLSEGMLLHIALRTDDVDAAYAHALENGGVEQTAPKDIEIPSDPSFPVRIAFVTGPDGEPVELFCEK
ncbi:MAG: VOC family protein [Spirochaetota bacterium]